MSERRSSHSHSHRDGGAGVNVGTAASTEIMSRTRRTRTRRRRGSHMSPQGRAIVICKAHGHPSCSLIEAQRHCYWQRSRHSAAIMMQPHWQGCAALHLGLTVWPLWSGHYVFSGSRVDASVGWLPGSYSSLQDSATGSRGVHWHWSASATAKPGCLPVRDRSLQDSLASVATATGTGTGREYAESA